MASAIDSPQKKGKRLHQQTNHMTMGAPLTVYLYIENSAGCRALHAAHAPVCRHKDWVYMCAHIVAAKDPDVRK